jgi:hypothetical protein
MALWVYTGFIISVALLAVQRSASDPAQSRTDPHSLCAYRDPLTKRKFKYGKERDLLVDGSANLGQQG